MKIVELGYNDLPYTHDRIHGALWRPGELPYTLENLQNAKWRPLLGKDYDKDDQNIHVFIRREHNFDFIVNIAKHFVDILNRYVTPGQAYYHPTQIALKTLSMLDGYMITHNKEYLQTVKKYSNKLLDLSVEINSALYFKFDHVMNLHGYKDQVMEPPYYSGMTQGKILSVFVRLFNIIKNDKYLKISDNIFNSFKSLKGETEPWVIYRDSHGYLWIEEYPMDIPCNTLNGFIFGIYGIYDYYLLTKNEESKHLLEETIKTVKHYISTYRNEGDVSYYCLKHKVKIPSYHRAHIDQLIQLYKFTGDVYFKDMAEKFYDDFH